MSKSGQRVNSQSRGPGFESRSDHLLDLKSLATLVNSQLVASCQWGF